MTAHQDTPLLEEVSRWLNQNDCKDPAWLLMHKCEGALMRAVRPAPAEGVDELRARLMVAIHSLPVESDSEGHMAVRLIKVEDAISAALSRLPELTAEARVKAKYPDAYYVEGAPDQHNIYAKRGTTLVGQDAKDEAGAWANALAAMQQEPKP